MIGSVHCSVGEDFGTTAMVLKMGTSRQLWSFVSSLAVRVSYFVALEEFPLDFLSPLEPWCQYLSTLAASETKTNLRRRF